MKIDMNIEITCEHKDMEKIINAIWKIKNVDNVTFESAYPVDDTDPLTEYR